MNRGIHSRRTCILRTSAACVLAIWMLGCPGASGGELVLDGPAVESFFGSLNLGYPGLGKVKASVERGDLAEAKSSLADYYRARTRPGWYWDREHASPLFSAHDDADADSVLTRRFTVLLKTAQLDRKIDWAANPFGDREWAWLLNRHQFFQALGMAYLRTGDERYALDFVEILTDWILRNPVPHECANNSHNWRTIEAGIRMLSSWPAAWHFFKDSPNFTPDVRMLMLRSMTEHADYLMRHPTGGNWNLMESNGLLHVGAIFPEFKDSPAWRETAIERLVRQMESQVYPDGAQFELSTSYHNVSLWNFLQPVMLRRISDGIDFPTSYYDGLYRMMLFNAGVCKPDGTWPMLNDSDTGSMDEWVKDQARALGLAEVPQAKSVLDVKPSAESVFFPYAGIFCMRTGNGPDDLYLMMDAGPYGAGHQHEDKLNVEVCAYGETFLLDPGRYSYHTGAPFRGPGAHNAVLVDGNGQNRAAADRATWTVSEPAPGNRWISRAGFDYAEGLYEEGFGPGRDTSVTHIRKILFVKPEYWIIVDVMTGEGDHEFEQMWHFAPGTIAASDGIARTVAPDRPTLAVISSDRPRVRIVEAEETPILGYVSYRYNEREAAPTAVFTRKCSSPAAFETVLVPSPAGGSVVPNVSPLRCLVDGKRPSEGDLSAISIAFPDREDVFVICHSPDTVEKTKRFLNYRFEGEWIWLSVDPRGKIIRQLASDDCDFRSSR